MSITFEHCIPFDHVKVLLKNNLGVVLSILLFSIGIFCCTFFFFFATLLNLWDLTSLTRDQTCIGSAESEPLDRHGSPYTLFLNN